MELKSPAITKCELNNSTHNEHPSDLKSWQNYIYRGLKNACGGKPCENNGTCQAGFTNKGYRCLCPPEFKGQKCTEDVNECTSATHKCHANADCVNIHGSYNCTCKAGYTGDGHNCTDINECAAPVNPCDAVANSECKNTNGSYNCQCKDGFVKNGPDCEVDVCRGYKVLNSSDRKDTYTVSGVPLCDVGLPEAWYRFEGDAGTRMPTTCVDNDKCGTNFPGWLNGIHPTVEDGEVVREVCFHAFSDCCNDRKRIRVKRCSTYYVYKLDGTLEGCNRRYCSTGSP